VNDAKIGSSGLHCATRRSFFGTCARSRLAKPDAAAAACQSGFAENAGQGTVRPRCEAPRGRSAPITTAVSRARPNFRSRARAGKSCACRSIGTGGSPSLVAFIERLTASATHIGSQITELDPFGDAFALLADFVAVLRADGHAITHLDLGGGLGIPLYVAGCLVNKHVC
jgi:hypothetical protein